MKDKISKMVLKIKVKKNKMVKNQEALIMDGRFSDEQKNEIKLGIENGIDVYKYALPTYSAEQMKVLREGLQEDLDVTFLLNPLLDSGQMYEIKHGISIGIDVSKYAKSCFDIHQMKEIRLGICSNIAVSEYIDPRYDFRQMREIRIGLEKGLCVLYYANPDFKWEQMQEIRLGLEQQLRVETYAKTYFSWEQMREIRFGLLEGHDVRFYAKSDITLVQMRCARKHLNDREHQKLENYVKQLTEELEELENDQDCAYLIPISRETKKRVGTCSFLLTDGGNTYDIAYCVHKSLWNKEYATEIAQSLISYARKKGASKVSIIVNQENMASRRVAEKCYGKIVSEDTFIKKGVEK